MSYCVIHWASYLTAIQEINSVSPFHYAESGVHWLHSGGSRVHVRGCGERLPVSRGNAFRAPRSRSQKLSRLLNGSRNKNRQNWRLRSSERCLQK